jgi:hypothetical protein
MKTSKHVFTSIVMASPDPFPPAPLSCSALKTPDPQSLGSSAFLVETEVTERTMKGTLMPLKKQLKEILKWRLH